MPAPLRYWTTDEAAAVKAALPDKLKHLVDRLPLLKHNCHDCELYIFGECLTAGQRIPPDKRRGSYDCYQPRELEPF